MRLIKKTPQLRGAISIINNTLGLQRGNYTTKARGVNSLQRQHDPCDSVPVAQDRETGFDTPIQRADITRYQVRFFCVRKTLRCASIMARRSRGAFVLAGFSLAGVSTLLRLATPFDTGERGSKELQREAAAMVATPRCTRFIDIYWIIPVYSTKPYGKVAFTYQDRRTFHSLFKDSRLILAGRQPVQGVTHG